MRSIRYVLRSLRKSPGYTALCVGVLGLSVAVSTAIFSFVYPVVLNALPYPEPERLVFVWERFLQSKDPMLQRFQVAWRIYREWQLANSVFADMAAYRAANLDETGGGRPVSVGTAFATNRVFPILGARAAVGRLFTGPEESVAVLSDAYFAQKYRRSAGALGKTIVLGGKPYTVIGTLPASFHLPATWEGGDQLKPEVWVPLARVTNETERQLFVIARMKTGVTLERARADIAAIESRISEKDPKTGAIWGSNVFGFSEEDTPPNLRLALLVLLGSVGFLLLIGCTNLASVSLARARERYREVAVRLALGASRLQIGKLLLLEAATVSVLGAGIGVALARWGIQLILALHPPDLQRPELVAINLPVLGFATAVCVVTTLLFGLAPALLAARTDLNSALKSGDRGASAGGLRGRQLTIAIEVTLAVMLMTGAGLMLRSLARLVSTGIGFDTAHLAVVDVELPEKRYADAASQRRFFHRLLERARVLPGAADAAITDHLPLHSVTFNSFHIAGRAEPPDDLPMADRANVSPGYFRTIGIRLLAGRWFSDGDVALTEKGTSGTVIVSEAFAKKYFPGESALGKRLLESDNKQGYEIAGVVADYRPMGAENGARPQIFRPSLQMSSGTLVIRTRASPGLMRALLEDTVHAIDPDLAGLEPKTMDSYVDQWQAQPKLNALLLGIFAAMALVLAMMGIYGVLANLVSTRVREIGIRMALGAGPGEVVRHFLMQGMIPVLGGVALGLAGSLLLSRFVESLLFEVRARDPWTLAVACVSMLALAPAALYVPLRRAAKIDCAAALRAE